MKLRYALLAFPVFAVAQVPTPNTPAAAEISAIDGRVYAAGEKLGAVLAQAERFNVAGRNEEADALILSVFPEANRSAEELLVLGNVLFKAQPKLAQEFHRQAAAKLPRYPNALLEWALEQHRAKNYSGAAQTYAAYSKLMPEYAPALGLAAECAIRTGNPAQAVALWKASEKARRGTLEQLESLVCEVNGRLPNESARAELLRRVEKRDERAARELLLLDAAWQKDWWNTSPRRAHLEHDVSAVKRVFQAPGALLRPALCVVECELLSQKAELGSVLARHGFVVDAAATLPSDGKALSHLLRLAMDQRIFSVAEAKVRFAERVLALARQSQDAEMYNVAAFLASGTDRLTVIDQEGWDRTRDARFAASRMVGLARQQDFSLQNELLRRALREFPDDSEIAAMAVRAAGENSDVLRPYLIQAIKAEYTRFSSARPGADLPRPSAYRLRQYFAMLEQCLAK